MVKDNNIDMYSTHNNERKSARALKNKIYKYMTSISKNGYIDKLEDIGYIYITIDITAQSK